MLRHRRRIRRPGTCPKDARAIRRSIPHRIRHNAGGRGRDRSLVVGRPGRFHSARRIHPRTWRHSARLALRLRPRRQDERKRGALYDHPPRKPPPLIWHNSLFAPTKRENRLRSIGAIRLLRPYAPHLRLPQSYRLAGYPIPPRRHYHPRRLPPTQPPTSRHTAIPSARAATRSLERSSANACSPSSAIPPTPPIRGASA